MKKITEGTQRLLRTIIDDCDKEDRQIRERQVRERKHLKLLWEGFTQIWYSEVAHDWRIYDPVLDGDNDQESYDKPINVFRAYLESIIAALSVTVPNIKCYPDDADNTLDLSTAKAGDQIAQLISRHNNVNLLWLHSLFIYCTEGMIGCYTYSKSSKEYGTYQKKEHKDENEDHDITTCPECGYQLDDSLSQPEQLPPPPPDPMVEELNTTDQMELPDSNTQEMGQIPEELPQEVPQEICPSCNAQIIPQVNKETFTVTKLVGVTNEPKSRICMEAYGVLNIKVPAYARRQEDCSYLTYDYECDVALAIEKYGANDKEVRDKIKSGVGRTTEYYDQWARLSPQYRGEYPTNVVTVSSTWLRPCKFSTLSDEDGIKELSELFPDGAKVILVNDQIVSVTNEALDDYWTLTYNPLSDHIHFNPIGMLLSSIQDITDEIISLTLQTIEHGIPQTFADPAILDFKAYREAEVLPGAFYPTKQVGSKKISEGFHEVKTATLSREILPFFQEAQSLGQLVSGATPSLFGGQLEGSDTASEYSMRRSQSLQRLQNTWKMLNCWWKDIYGKVIPMYIKEVKKIDEDERDVQQDKDGNFINVFIRKSELEGKIGKVELDANENIPLTWSQRRDILEKLLQNANPEILKIIASPENLPLLHEALGITEFYVPGEDDRAKQYDEIKLLLNSEPITQPPDEMAVQQAIVNGLPPPTEIELPSIEIEPEVDDHEVQFAVCRKWLVSEAGRQAKTDNRQGYRNILLHAKMHLQIVQQTMMQQQTQNNGNPDKPNENLETPVVEESDVSTAQ